MSEKKALLYYKVPLEVTAEPSIALTFAAYQAEARLTRLKSTHEHEVLYPAIALAEETGEVLGCVKRMLRDDGGQLTPARRLLLIDELGDALWYASALADDLGVTLEEVAQLNLIKVLDRMARGVIGGSGDKR